MSYQIKNVLILDLDGTVRRNKHNQKSFINEVSDIELVPGIEEKIMSYYNAGWYIAGATNQGGVAFGFKTEEQVRDEIKFTMELFNRNPFTSIAYSICHADGKEPFNVRSLLRKPYYGMLAIIEHQMAQQSLLPNWDNSIFVGDTLEDEGCAKNAGIQYIDINDFLRKTISKNE